ncbi:MAG: glycine--tRNA ligase subunit beta, partial [Burkholderiaceae bacterium]
MAHTLLVELLTEELPPKALQKLGNAFGGALFEGLRSNDFLEDGATLTVFATPRRLAAHISQVREISLPKERVTKLMPVSVGRDAEGRPTPALIKKLKGMYHEDIDVDALLTERVTVAHDGKTDVLVHRELAAGTRLAIRLEGALEDAIKKLPVPKVMSYQLADGETTVQFVRPAHKLIALHGADVVPVEILGLTAGRTTLGHRFLSPGELTIADADTYAATLTEQGKVIASFPERRDAIRAALLAAAGDDRVLMPEALLDEVTALVEWPVVYACRFEERFLSVPQECLILTMQTNQKYFALTDAEGKLRSRFLVVSNIETADSSSIVGGNERVVRPRLSDAQFFFEQDKKKSLASRVPQLASVVYHNKLGNQLQRTERVTALAERIAGMLDADAGLAVRAATLAKADLLTDMVG